MIHICDLICKEMSHEKVNSGFVYGLRLAFPDEKIVVYADKSHIDALANILKVDGDLKKVKMLLLECLPTTQKC